MREETPQPDTQPKPPGAVKYMPYQRVYSEFIVKMRAEKPADVARHLARVRKRRKQERRNKKAGRR